MTDAAAPTPLATWIDSRPLSRVQYLVAILCGLVAVADGFEVQSVAFAAPAIMREWAVPEQQLGLIFSAGLLGMLIGVLLQGPVADRIGRRPVIIASVLTFGLFSLAIAFASRVEELLVLRFLAGLGMGAAVPNFIALTAEYAPGRIKARMIVAMNAGFPLGGFIGGMASAGLLGEYGWRSIFIVGGVAPLILAVVLIFFLPESILFSAEQASRRGEAGGGARTLRLLKKLARPGESIDPNVIEAAPHAVLRPTFSALFAEGRAVGTLLLWLAFFGSLILFYFLVSWLPTLITQAGLPPERAVVAAAILNFGSVIGGFVLGWLADKLSPAKVLSVNYLTAGVACIVFGMSIGEGLLVVIPLAALLGFCCGGGQLMLNALGAIYYPTAIRSTGLGAAGMAGRAGSLVGPLLGGVLLGTGMTVATLFAWLAVPAAVSAAAVGLIRARGHSNV